MSEKLCLKWNDFQENTTSAFAALKDDRDLSDVTLVCEDGKQIEGHKVILAASSPFFFDLLKRNKHPNPLIYMRGVKYEILGAMIDFFYLGEANVFQEHLDAFLALAEELKLKGLTGKADDKEPSILEPKEENEKIRKDAYKINLPSQHKNIRIPPKTFPETRIALSANEQTVDADHTSY